MLELRNISKNYSGITVVNNVSFIARPGEVTGYLGPNGSGKSTTMKIVTGLIESSRGEVLFDGQPIHRKAAHQRVPLGLSLVPEGRRLFPRLSVRRNLELGAFTRKDPHEVAAGIDEMFALFPILKEREAQQAGTMSGGEQQMLAIARGLMARPKLLMLDEPSWGIAPKFVARVLEVIQQINQQGVSVLLVEQNLQKALGIAHYGYVIQTGRIVMEGTGQALLHDDRIKKAYLGL